MAEETRRGSWALAGAGVLGFLGVGAAAMSAHSGGDPRLANAVALVCLAHAPALMALGLMGRRNALLQLAAMLMFFGAALFSADIGLRMLERGRLFAMAAPAGGLAMMAGWSVVVAAAATIRRGSD